METTSTEVKGASKSVPERYLWFPRVLSLLAIVAMLLLVVTAAGGLDRDVSRPLPIPLEAGGYTLAIAPVNANNLDGEWRWISHGGQLLMQQALQGESAIQLVAPESVNSAIELFQAQGEENSINALGGLLGADYVLVSKAVASETSDELALTMTLISTHDGLRSTVLQSSSIARADLFHTFQQIPALVRDVLRLDGAGTAPTPLWTVDAELYSKARLAFELGDVAEARQYLQRLLEVEPEYAPGWLMLARAEYLSGDTERALASVETAIHTSAENSVTALQARALDALWREDGAAAEAYLRRLIASYPNLADVRMDLAEFLMERGDFEAAGAALRKLVDKYPKNAHAWLALAKTAIVAGNLQRAVDEYLPRAEALYAGLDNRAGQGNVRNAFGVAYQRLGDWAKAEKHYLAGYQLRYAEDDKRGQIVSLSNLATLQGMRGNPEAGMDTLEKARLIADALDDPAARSEIFNQMGLIREEQGHYTDALVHYRKALSIRMRMEDRWLQAESQNNVGFVYYLLADFDHAMIYWRQAAENFAFTNDALGEVQVKLNVAQLDLQRGYWPEALQVLQSARRMAEQAGLEEEVIIAQAYLGRLAFLQGSFQSADKYWSQASEFVAMRGDLRGAIEFGLWRAELALVLGKQERAAVHLADLEGLLKEHGSPDQWVSEKFLRFRLAMDGHDLAHAGEIYRDIQSMLSDQVPQYLHLRAKAAALELNIELEQTAETGTASVNMTDDPWVEYPLERLRWLEVAATKQWQAGELGPLEKTLRRADQIMERLDGYWKGYLFHQLKFVLSLEQGKGDTESRQAANRIYSEILNNIDPADRYVFQARNALPDALARN